MIFAVERMTNAAIVLAGLSGVVAGLIAFFYGTGFWLGLLICAAAMSISCMVLLISLLFRKPDHARISRELERDLMALEERKKQKTKAESGDQSRR